MHNLPIICLNECYVLSRPVDSLYPFHNLKKAAVFSCQLSGIYTQFVDRYMPCSCFLITGNAQGINMLSGNSMAFVYLFHNLIDSLSELIVLFILCPDF